MADPIADLLRQALAKNLAAMSVGQGGDPDVFSQVLGQVLSKDMTMLASGPGAEPAAGVPVPDAPHPADLDEDEGIA